MRNGNTISVINQKGGVNKTTVVLHLGAALANKGYKVLLIDLDLTQANLSVSTVGELSPGEKGIINAFFGDATLREVKREYRPNLDIIPSEIKYQGLSIPLDLALSSTMAKESVLKKLLAPIKNEYDFIFIDNGPSLGIATINSLICSEYFIIPSLADYLSLVGIQKTMETVELIKTNLDHKIKNLGIVLTMVDGREKIAKDSSDILNSAFEGDVFQTKIQRNVKFKDLAQGKTTIFDQETSKDKGSSNYNSLALEVLEKLKYEVKIPTKKSAVPRSTFIENDGAI
jgi:chromosome partitioning protein